MNRFGAVGIDFGTATTLLAEQTSAGLVDVLPLGRMTTWLPSVARLTGSHRIVVGEDADDASAEQIRGIKRAITDRRDSVTVTGSDGPGQVPADAVIVELLREVRHRASALGVALDAPRPVRLGCPAMWDGEQRRRLLRLAAVAGLPVEGATLVDEPIAAGLAWLSHRYLRHGERPEGTMLVFDMGGGTLDVAVLAVRGGPRPRATVLACLGVALAGDALDAAIARDLAAEMAANRIDVTQHPRPELAWSLLERAAREAKIRLSSADVHPVVLPRQLAYPQPLRYRREQLERALRAQLDGAQALVVSALRAARMSRGSAAAGQLRALDAAELVGDIDVVLLAGGMSRMPYLAVRLGELFAHAAIHTDAGVAPEEIVVAGLADAAGYDQIALHRPSVDFLLEWESGSRHWLYQAYSPLFEPWQVYSGSDLAYQRTVRPPEVPAGGEGWLRALTIDGQVVPLRVAGHDAPGLGVEFGPAGVSLRIEAGGGLELRDARPQPLRLHADAWPVVHDANTPLVLRPRFVRADHGFGAMTGGIG